MLRRHTVDGVSQYKGRYNTHNGSPPNPFKARLELLFSFLHSPSTYLHLSFISSAYLVQCRLEDTHNDCHACNDITSMGLHRTLQEELGMGGEGYGAEVDALGGAVEVCPGTPVSGDIQLES